MSARLFRFLPALALLLAALSLFHAAPVAANHGSLNTPTDLQATAGDGSVTLTWNQADTSSDTVPTSLEYGEHPSGTTTTTNYWVWGTDRQGRTGTISGLTNNTTYRFRVRSAGYTTHSASGWTDWVTATPQGDHIIDLGDRTMVPGERNICVAPGLRDEFREQFPDICAEYPHTNDVGPETERRMNPGATGSDPLPVTLQAPPANGDPQPSGQVPTAPYDALISEMYGWRNDPQYVRHKSHTDRLDRVLLAFGERVADATLTPMPPAQARKWADEGWGDAWTRMAAALGAIVTGTSGPDTLTGTGDGELLAGLGGADILSGHGGNDELRGGDGDDDLTGGAGADRFVFLAGETGAKAITDFASGDVIVLKGGGWSSAADIIATVQAVDSTNYRYTLASGLTVETTNNRTLRTENFVVE